MRGDQHGLPHVLEALQNPLHFGPRAGIHARGWLVQYQQLRIVDQRVRQAQPLLHAARQRIHIGVLFVAQVHKVQQLRSHARALGLAKAVAPGVKIQVFPAFQMVVHAEEVGHIPHQLPYPAGVFGHVHAVDHRRARGRREQRGQDAHGGGFSGAVGADKAVQLAVADAHGKMVERREMPVHAGKLPDFQHYLILPSSVSAGLYISFPFLPAVDASRTNSRPSPSRQRRSVSPPMDTGKLPTVTSSHCSFPAL